MTSENEFGIPEIKLEGKAPAEKTDQWGRPWRTIRVEEEAEKENYIPVGHNGDTYQIKRGEAVDVPQCVVDVLNDAIAGKLNPSTGALTDYRSVPFQILK